MEFFTFGFKPLAMKSNLPIIIFGAFFLLTLVIFLVFRNREDAEEPKNEIKPIEEQEKSDSDQTEEST